MRSQLCASVDQSSSRCSCSGVAPVRQEQLLHALVGAPFPRHPQRVTGAFDRRIRKGAALEEELRDLVVSVIDRRVERLALGRELLLGQIGVGAVIEKQLHDVHAADRGGI